MNVLSFIKENCVKEGGTYWIFKDHDKNQIQLYDISNEKDNEPKEDGKEEGVAESSEESAK